MHNTEPHIPMTITIAGRSFPVEVTLGEQEMLTGYVERINDQIAAYKQAYPSKDNLDCVIMAMLMSAIEMHKQHTESMHVVDQDLSSLVDILSAAQS
jgi:cell division protein ZapA (FtsZ GTPase activity inhibitor)